MPRKYTNTGDLPLSLSVWLAHDSYDHDSRTNHISATSILKPIRQLVLSSRIDHTQQLTDISALIAAKLGTAIHDSIEHSWTANASQSLVDLGIPERVANNVVINPEKDTDLSDKIPVYLEQRAEKEVDGFIISGKFDFVGEGRVEDFKTTSVYTYINKSNDEKYIQQGSIYRWLNPDLITRDDMAIQFIFTDWSSARASYEKNYPSSRTMEYKLDLMSLSDTEHMIRNKVAQIKQHWQQAEHLLPPCSDEDLWKKPTVYKYYKKPDAKRATKVFSNPHEAHAKAHVEGGIVKEFPGEVVACKYCDAFAICSQKDQYLRSGELKM